MELVLCCRPTHLGNPRGAEILSQLKSTLAERQRFGPRPKTYTASHHGRRCHLTGLGASTKGSEACGAAFCDMNSVQI